MKIPKNIFRFAALFAAVLLLSACEYEDEWRKGQLLYPANIPVPPTGLVHHDFSIGYEWIGLTTSLRFDYIEQFVYKGGYIDIYTGNYIRSLTISMEDSDATLPVRINGSGGAYLKHTDPPVNYFLTSMAELIRQNGYARIYIDGDADPGMLEIDFYLNLDVYVHY